MADMRRLMRGNEFSPGQMPFPGGFAEQPAPVIAAFEVMAAAEETLNAKFDQATKGPPA